MKEIRIATTFGEYAGLEALPADVRFLMDHAIMARRQAYAPYSNFRVGAALLLDNGEVVKGSNQENAAYPSGLCAERVAIFAAGANHPEAKVVRIAISAAADSGTTNAPIPPCGACRQAIAEYEHRQEEPIEIWFMGETGCIYKSDSLRNLLPLSFDKNFL